MALPVKLLWGRAGAPVLRLERLLTRLITSPHVRWPAVLTLAAFMTVQVVSTCFQSVLPSKLRSGFGLNPPWRMFATPPPVNVFLEATAITASGQRFTIPVHSEIYTHYRGLSQIRAFEEGQWLMSDPDDGDVPRKRALAIYFRDRLLGWGIEAVEIEFRAKLIPQQESQPIVYAPMGAFKLPPPPPMPHYFQMPPPDPRIPW